MTRPLRIGFIGLGRIFTLHLLGYRDDPRVELVAACDPNAEARAAAAEAVSGMRVHADVEALLAEGLDLVEVLSPHTFHAEHVVQALASGAHVSVQKPMAIDDAEALRMEQAAAAHGRMLRVYENYLFYEPLVRAKAIIDSGVIGRPLHLRLRTLAGNPAHAWQVPADAWRWRASLFAEKGFGRLTFDDGHHRLATALWLFGPVRDVMARIDQTPSRFGPVDAPASILWRHADSGVHAIWDVVYAPELTIRSDYYALDERFEITCERGILKINRAAGRMLDEPVLTLYRDGVQEVITDVADDWGLSFRHCTRHLVDSILAGTEPRLSAAGGRAVLALGHAIGRSARSGRAEHPVSGDVP